MRVNESASQNFLISAQVVHSITFLPRQCRLTVFFCTKYAVHPSEMICLRVHEDGASGVGFRLIWFDLTTL